MGELRDRFITLARNTNNVENVYKFKVNRDIMQPNDPLYFDHTNIELTIAVFPDQSARRKAIADMNNMEPGLIDSFTSTTDCIMCLCWKTISTLRLILHSRMKSEAESIRIPAAIFSFLWR